MLRTSKQAQNSLTIQFCTCLFSNVVSVWNCDSDDIEHISSRLVVVCWLYSLLQSKLSVVSKQIHCTTSLKKLYISFVCYLRYNCI